MTKMEERSMMAKILLDLGEEVELTWRVGTSRAYGCEGQTLVSALLNGNKVGQCRGGGYDMRGSCFGDFLNAAFHPEMVRLVQESEKELYGLRGYNGYVNGACGLDCMFRIFNELGYEAEYVRGSGRKEKYILRKKGA